jgi:hypothetical protein
MELHLSTGVEKLDVAMYMLTPHERLYVCNIVWRFNGLLWSCLRWRDNEIIREIQVTVTYRWISNDRGDSGSIASYQPQLPVL